MLAKLVQPQLDEVVLRGLARDPKERYQTAEEMAVAIEQAAPTIASAHVVGQWVRQLGGERLQARAQRVMELESVSSSLQLITGSGVISKAHQAPPAAEPKKSELWKIAIVAGVLVLLL